MKGPGTRRGNFGKKNDDRCGGRRSVAKEVSGAGDPLVVRRKGRSPGRGTYIGAGGGLLMRVGVGGGRVGAGNPVIFFKVGLQGRGILGRGGKVGPPGFVGTGKPWSRPTSPHGERGGAVPRPSPVPLREPENAVRPHRRRRHCIPPHAKEVWREGLKGLSSG